MEAIYRPIQMTFREPIIIAVNLYIGVSPFLEFSIINLLVSNIHVKEQKGSWAVRLCSTLLILRIIPPGIWTRGIRLSRWGSISTIRSVIGRGSIQFYRIRTLGLVRFISISVYFESYISFYDILEPFPLPALLLGHISSEGG